MQLTVMARDQLMQEVAKLMIVPTDEQASTQEHELAAPAGHDDIMAETDSAVLGRLNPADLLSVKMRELEIREMEVRTRLRIAEEQTRVAVEQTQLSASPHC